MENKYDGLEAWAHRWFYLPLPLWMSSHTPIKSQAQRGLPFLLLPLWLLQQPGERGLSSASTLCTSRSQGKAKVGSMSGMHPAASWGEVRQCQSLLGSDSIMVILVGNSVRPSLPLLVLISYNLLGVTCPLWVRAIGPQKVKLTYPSRTHCLHVLFAKGGIN